MLAEIFLPTADLTSGSATGEFLSTDTLDEEDTITDWIAFSGDYVHKGQILGHAEVRGAVMDIAAPAAGVLHILVLVDRPIPALSLVGVIDTAPDARSFTVTFTPAGLPPVKPATPSPTRPEWTVSLPTPASPWSTDPVAVSSLAGAAAGAASAPPAAPERVLPMAPQPSLESMFHKPMGQEVAGSTCPPATRLPLLSRQIATPSLPREPLATPPSQPPPPVEPPAEPAASADSSVPSKTQRTPEAPDRTSLPVSTPSSIAAIPAPRARLYASPRARSLAGQTSVDLISLQGSGPFGRVEEDDVRQYLDAHAAPGAPATRRQEGEPASPTEANSVIIIDTVAIIPQTAEPPAPVPTPTPCERESAEAAVPVSSPAPDEPTSTQSTVSVSAPVSVETAPVEATSPESQVNVAAPVSAETAPVESPRPEASFAPPDPMPHHALSTGQVATLAVQVDATDLMLMRARLTTGIQKRTGEPLALSVMLAKLVALALRDHPALNARQTDHGLQIVPTLDLALATDTLPGHAAPVLTDPAGKDLLTLSREAVTQAKRARADGGIPANARPASFTIVTLGDGGGVDVCTPAPRHPECATLGVGRVAPRPVVLEGQVVVRHTVFLSLSYHSAFISAAQAASFLTRLRAIVEDPAPLAEGLIC